MPDDREHDLVLFGATSYVGRLTTEYLKRATPAGVRVALAGRSPERLARLQADTGTENWPVLVADTADAAAVRELAASTHVLATTVGPYRRYGMPAVEACARAGTHYADLTGELPFIREAIDRFEGVARESGARIVHACGFDSVPSDLGVLLLHEAVEADGGGALEDVTLAVRSMRGGASGGTVDSIRGVLEERREDPAVRRLLDDPYALSPDRPSEPELGSERDLAWVQHDSELGMWIGPFAMASFNTRVVRRSNALLDHAYGRRMRYREVMAFGDGPLAPVQAGAVAAGTAGLVAGMSFPPTRTVLDRLLPSPGQGPSERARERGFFELELHARTSDDSSYLAIVAARGDPGYKATSVMLGESALALALDGEQLPDRAGVLTPATGIGRPLIDRLRAAGHTYEAERVGPRVHEQVRS